jgi:hypothetical protein
VCSAISGCGHDRCRKKQAGSQGKTSPRAGELYLRDGTVYLVLQSKARGKVMDYSTKYCIVGAGPAGITSAKNLKDKAVQPQDSVVMR